MAAEIRQGRPVDHRPRARLQLVLEDGVRVRPGDGVQRVVAHAEARGEQGADRVEVEQRLHQREILRDGVDDFDLGPLDLDRPQAIDVDIGGVRNLVGGDRLGMGEDRLGDALRRGPPSADIVFDAEIAVRPAGIVARRQDYAAEGVERADQGGDGGRRENAALAHDDAAEAVRRGDLDHDLDRLAVEEAAVTAENERLALKTLERIEGRLDEVFEVAGALEDRDLLAQTRGARPLVGERLGGDGPDHRRSPMAALRGFSQARAL